MHIISTINAKTQSVDNVPVVLVNVEGRRKFLPRPETHKEMQRLVRAHYEIDPNAVLQFEVSTWDVCGGQNVEVTESAYVLLAPFLDSVSVVVASGRGRTMPTPSATPSLHEEDGTEDEQSVEEQLEPKLSQGRMSQSPSRRTAARAPKVKSEEEEEILHQGEDDMDDATSALDDEEENRARRVPKEFPIQSTQAKEEQRRPMPKERGEPVKPVAANRSDETAESSQQGTASDADERFKIIVSGPSDLKGEFMTRGGHLVRKVLSGVCKTFKLDADRAKLMLCVEMEDEDGETGVHLFECANEETIARSGVKAYSRLVVRLVESEEEDYDD
ncbi:hypothetical protein DFH09DRAFT_1119849 [Mycena vulgaris]|nr:hypothetical protein DFH09DRAFT_1119849 [Mycena vulgaris]